MNRKWEHFSDGDIYEPDPAELWGALVARWSKPTTPKTIHIIWGDNDVFRVVDAETGRRFAVVADGTVRFIGRRHPGKPKQPRAIVQCWEVSGPDVFARVVIAGALRQRATIPGCLPPPK